MKLIITYGKQIGLIALSVFIPYVILAKLENTFIPYRLNYFDETNGITLYDLKILFAHNMPLFFVIAFVFQLLIVIPTWNKIKKAQAHSALVLSEVLSISILSSFAFGLSIGKLAGDYSGLFSSTMVLTTIQLLYWILIYFTLYTMYKFKATRCEIIF